MMAQATERLEETQGLTRRDDVDVQATEDTLRRTEMRSIVLQLQNLMSFPMVRERVATYRRAGVTTLRVDPGGRTVAERLDTLARFMDLVRAT